MSWGTIKNNTGSDVTITDVGQTVPANATAFDPGEDKRVNYANSNDFISLISGGSPTLTFNDGNADLSPSDAIDHIKNFQQKMLLDVDLAPMSRLKQATAGYTFQARAIEFETAVDGSLVNQNPTDGTDWGDATLKFYKDVSGTWTECTDTTDRDNNCERTVLDWEPNYDMDLIGGFLDFETKPTVDVLISCIGVPDLTEAQGGTKIMISNINAKYLSEGSVRIDGRTTKHMLYNATYHTNKMRFIILHPKGTNNKHKLQVVWEHFKA